MKLICAVLLSMFAMSSVVEAHPSHRSKRERALFVKKNPCPSSGQVTPQWGCKGYVVDHIIPLCAGGHDRVYNMAWQSIAESKAKDGEERRQCRRNAKR